MEHRVTLSELESRWEKALVATRSAARNHPRTYRALKSLAARIIEAPVDINDYFPTVERLLDHLQRLDPSGRGSIFHLFCSRISPTNIWQVRQLRQECRDLLAHLDAFDQWRRRKSNLKRIK
jgi:hypothetical protein